MRTMTSRQLKNETGRALQMASRGERVLITRRGKPIAWLVAASPQEPEEVDADSAWTEVIQALDAEAPAFEDWRSATNWSRGRG